MASERSRRCFILPFAASARRMSRPANISATRATTKLSESFRRFVQSVPNLLPARSAVRSIARIARIAFSISTPPSPPIAAAESFDAWFSISNTATQVHLLPSVGELALPRPSMMNASAAGRLTSLFPCHSIPRANDSAVSIKRRCSPRSWSAGRCRSRSEAISSGFAIPRRRQHSIANKEWRKFARRLLVYGKRRDVARFVLQASR